MNRKAIFSIIETAKSLLGRPYKYAAKIEEAPNCFDCSLFSQYLFLKKSGKDIGRSAILQATKGKKVSEKNLKPGDLIFFRSSQGHYNDKLFPPKKYGYNMCIGHVILYIGNGLVIHASGIKMKVVEESLKQVKKERGKIKIIKRY